MAVLEDLLVKLGFKVESQGLEHANEYLEGINHKLELLAGIEIAKGLYELVEHFSGVATGLEQAAYQAGVTAEEFQKLVYAGSQFSVSQEQIQGALAKMSRLLQNARDGSKGAIEQFAKLGISKEQVKSFANAEEAFYAVQDAIAGIPDSIKRIAATTAIFGRGNYALAKFAASGSQASRKLGEEAERMGAVVTNEGIEGLAKFEESMKAIGLTIRGFMGNLAGAFAPAIRAVVKDVQMLIGTNSQLFRQNVDVWAERIAYGLDAVVELFRVVTKAISDYIAEHPKLIAFVTKTVGVLIGMSIASGVLKLAFGGLKSAIALISASVSLLGGRLTLIMIGVAGLVLGLKALWDMAHGKSFEDTTFFKSFSWLKDYAMDAGRALKEVTFGDKGAPSDETVDPKLPNVPTAVAARIARQHKQMMALMPKELNSTLAPDFFLPDTMNLPGITNLADGLGTLSKSGMRRGAGAPTDSRVMSNVTQNLAVTVPMTVNVSNAKNAKEMAVEMEKMATQVFTQVAQRTHRDHLPAAMR